jgi:hypothetical protein
MNVELTFPVGLDPNAPLFGTKLEDNGPERNAAVAQALATLETIYIQWPPQVEFHSRCDFLQKLGRATRGRPQKGMRVLAPTGSGKTTAAEQFVRLAHPPGSPGPCPIAHIALETEATSKRLISSFLQWFGDSDANKGTEATLKLRLYAYIERFGTELLIIDEVQHLNFRSGTKRDVTDTLKRFLDDGIVPIVFLGTEEAEGLFSRNLQLNGRLLAPCDLHPLNRANPNDRRNLHQFLTELDVAMVQKGIVKQLSGLQHPWIRGCLNEVSAGLLGRICELLFEALQIALRRGSPCIEVFDLALATDRWAIAQSFVKSNPFRTSGSAQ